MHQQPSLTRHEQAPPPPPVVLGAELEVGEHDRDLRDRHEQDGDDQGQEPKHIVELLEPQARHDEVELHEHRAAG